MSALALPTRRILLKDMGRAGLAVLVLGVSACASEETGNATPTDEPGSPTTTPAAPSTSSTDSPSTTAGPGHSWRRADLAVVSAYILYRGGEATLIDTGVPNSEGAIGAALTETGLGWDAVSNVILTHKHGDHQGSLEAVLGLASEAEWHAGAADIAAITAPTEGRAVGDGDRVFDMEVIETPGHTPGHISVLDQMAGILVAGDALNGTGGGVTGANPSFSEDMSLADSSVAKLAGFDYEIALFGHGEPVLSGASGAVAELASSLG